MSDREQTGLLGADQPVRCMLFRHTASEEEEEEEASDLMRIYRSGS